MTKIHTFLPIFPGFSDTIFEADESNEFESINQEREDKGLPPVTLNECKFDYEGYRERVAKKACEFVAEALKLIIPVKIQFEGIYSPKYFNFENHSINIELNLSIAQLVKYLKENKTEFDAFIKKKCTSRDGFVSFYSDSGSEWLKYIKNKYEVEHVIGTCLDFVCLNEGMTDDLMAHHCEEEILHVSAKNYSELVGE